VIVALAVGACVYQPDLAPCRVRCGDKGVCPNGWTCNEDGFCRAPEGNAVCPGRDAASGEEGDAGEADGGQRIPSEEVDAELPTDAGAEGAVDGPAPMAVQKRLVAGAARLVGQPQSACSHQVPASLNGDRWCAFSRVAGENTELWVVDVTRWATDGFPCDGSDRRCLRLTDKLWTGTAQTGPTHPSAHRFEGDTLIFHVDVPKAGPLFAGPIFAWRPGWPQARQITGGQATACWGHLLHDALSCIENLDTRVPISFDLTATRLMSGPARKVTRTYPVRADGASQYGQGFSPDGQYFAFSQAGPTEQEPETLYVVRTDSIGTQPPIKVVSEEIARWKISPDGQKVYYLRGFNSTTASGTLMMADFPGGGNEAALADNVGTFRVLDDGRGTDRGLLLATNASMGRAVFRIMRDRNAPADLQTFALPARDVLLSRDLSYAFYIQSVDPQTGLSDAWVTPIMPIYRCGLAPSGSAALFGAPFSGGSRRVFWADNVDTTAGTGRGWSMPTSGCGARSTYGERVEAWFVHHEEGMIFSERESGGTVVLRFITFKDDVPQLGPAVEIRAGVDPLFAIVPGWKAVLFSINAGTEADGLYLDDSLPFSGVEDPTIGLPW
jgi:hypothetical protein